MNTFEVVLNNGNTQTVRATLEGFNITTRAGTEEFWNQMSYEKINAHVDSVLNWYVQVQHRVYSQDTELNQPRPAEDLYRLYMRLNEFMAKYCEVHQVKCPAGLSPQLVGLEGKKVEAVTMWGEVIKFKVGRSTGWCPCHLEIQGNQDGGMSASKQYKSVKVIQRKR